MSIINAVVRNMVIYDKNNNNGGLSKGTLYLSIMDIDYIVLKYGISYLFEQLPEDYVECFINELKSREKEDKLSIQYYPTLQLGIETEEDTRLLEIISEEVKNGNLCTKKELQSLSLEELEKRLSDMEYVKQNINSATLEEIYRYRSYEMSKFIINCINDSNLLVSKMYEAQANGNVRHHNNLYKEYCANVENLQFIGVSSDIQESDYFEKRTDVCQL